MRSLLAFALILNFQAQFSHVWLQIEISVTVGFVESLNLWSPRDLLEERRKFFERQALVSGYVKLLNILSLMECSILNPAFKKRCQFFSVTLISKFGRTFYVTFKNYLVKVDLFAESLTIVKMVTTSEMTQQVYH